MILNDSVGCCRGSIVLMILGALVASALAFDRKLFSETCDARALPLVGGGSESVWKGGSRGGVVWG